MNEMRVHSTLSVIVALAIGAEPLRCWRNAALAALSFPKIFAEGSYVEGWTVIPREQFIEIVAHGWCSSPDVGIVDPSLVFERPDQPIWYFPGFELPGGKVAQHIAGKTVPLVCNSQYGSDGMGHLGYKQSYNQAWRLAQELATERSLPQDAIKVSSRDRTRRGFTIIPNDA